MFPSGILSLKVVFKIARNDEAQMFKLPGVLRVWVDPQGHEVGNHLMADKPAHAHSPEQFERELIQVDAILRPFWYHTVFCRRFNFLGARSTK